MIGLPDASGPDGGEPASDRPQGDERRRPSSADRTDGTGRASAAGRLAGWAVVVVCTLVAFHGLLIPPLLASDPAAFDYWFFLPTRESSMASVLLAAWLLWNRRRRIRALDASRVPIAGAVAAVGLVALHAWSVATGSPLLGALSLAGFLATLAGLVGGRTGLRCVAMPCLALLVALPPPNPLLSEIVWQLQRLTAVGAHAVSQLAGFPVVLEGTELRRGQHAFLIIEACSGWRGIQILSLVALAAGELNALPIKRVIAVVLAAWPIGIALNVARACLVVLTKEELELDLFATHTPQGIAVLLVGSALLYGLAWTLRDRSRDRRAVAPAPEVGTADRDPAVGGSAALAGSADGGRHGTAVGRPRVAAVALSVVLALVSVLLPVLGATREAPSREPLDLPLEHAGWSGTPIPVDYLYPYDSSLHPQLRVEYRRKEGQEGLRVVDLFVARELPMATGLNRMPDSKLLRPASDWSLEWRETTRIWEFGLEGEQAVLAREQEAERAFVLAWRWCDGGLLLESLTSLAGLDACSERGASCSRMVVRVAVPIVDPDTRASERARDHARDRAARTARQFVRDFAASLESLARAR